MQEILLSFWKQTRSSYSVKMLCNIRLSETGVSAATSCIGESTYPSASSNYLKTK